jgi:hypothetical protein
MRRGSEKQSSANKGTRRADRMSDAGGRRSQQAEASRKEHGTEARPSEQGAATPKPKKG